MWYDPIGRQKAIADYGTGGGTAPTRPDSAPASSDTVLVATTEYNARAEAHKTVDPAGRDDRTVFDDAGRVTKTIQDYVDGTAGGPDTSAEQTWPCGTVVSQKCRGCGATGGGRISGPFPRCASSARVLHGQVGQRQRKPVRGHGEGGRRDKGGPTRLRDERPAGGGVTAAEGLAGRTCRPANPPPPRNRPGTPEEM